MTIKCPKCRSENPETARFCADCGTQIPAEEVSVPTETLEAPKEELTTGSTFAGRYQIIEELGKGGMGKVYKAVDKEIDGKVALKLIKPEIAADGKTIERFRNELKTARDIAHKNVCRMYHLAKHEGTHYIVMEYVSGEDLKSFIRRSRQVTPGTAISIAKQVCEGLTEAHKLGTVHRDLKPQNIMIDKDGNARIMDFGIARSLKEKGITGAGVMIGTPEYMSPEQVEAKEVDQRSDIYSLGVILYEMVTGRVPFEADTPFAIGVKHKSEAPKDPRELNTQIPEGLSIVILRCLEKDKAKRYQSADELHTELTNIEKGIPFAEKIVPERRPSTSKEITVTFGLRKLLIPALVVIALVILGIVIWQLLPQKEAVPEPATKPSIAVLPFADLSPQKDQEYFCDGMANAIINALSNIKGLSVRARGSSFAFKGQQQDLQEIGKRLNVATVLDGTVQKAGNRVRLTAQLINVADESLLWSGQYDQELDNIFAIQDEITQAITDNLELKLLGGEKAKLTKRYTKDVQAFSLYSQGLYHWNRRTGEAMQKAIDYFEQAIEEDSTYALAYVGLADSYNLLSIYSDVNPKESYPKAREAAEKALEIDETLGEAHNSLAYFKERYEWDFAGAEREFKRAIELSPNYATGHFWYGELLAIIGRFDEGIEEMKKALELDPISLIINASLGWAYRAAKKYDQAITQLHKTLEMDPNFLIGHFYLGMVHTEMKKYPEAIVELEKAKELSGGAAVALFGLGVAYAEAGKPDEAKRILEELEAISKERYVSPWGIGSVYAALGEKDKAFEFMQKAYEERDEQLIFYKIDPISDPVRSDPRFKELLNKIGLEK
ncbi:MAG: protein kinase [Candidatus Aminicenantes bacterium]|nr:protein kinase [Candidatus Aminicenantes bacterium]